MKKTELCYFYYFSSTKKPKNFQPLAREKIELLLFWSLLFAMWAENQNYVPQGGRTFKCFDLKLISTEKFYTERVSAVQL